MFEPNSERMRDIGLCGLLGRTYYVKKISDRNTLGQEILEIFEDKQESQCGCRGKMGEEGGGFT